ncbi:30S ribosomal protein S9 [Babesia ovis]|uniref:30S ribosomal protein S9 n=1 Tax=Babesia ovis TaxID=5869 RepID=A0A9W5WTW9_BABOV|nr:30S ribosomal protein S9 [Babesia ovis]
MLAVHRSSVDKRFFDEEAGGIQYVSANVHMSWRSFPQRLVSLYARPRKAKDSSDTIGDDSELGDSSASTDVTTGETISTNTTGAELDAITADEVNTDSTTVSPEVSPVQKRGRGRPKKGTSEGTKDVDVTAELALNNTGEFQVDTGDTPTVAVATPKEQPKRKKGKSIKRTVRSLRKKLMKNVEDTNSSGSSATGEVVTDSSREEADIEDTYGTTSEEGDIEVDGDDIDAMTEQLVIDTSDGIDDEDELEMSSNTDNGIDDGDDLELLEDTGGSEDDLVEDPLNDSMEDVVVELLEDTDNGIDDDLPLSETSDNEETVTFVKMLEQQLASRRRRLPKSFYAEDLYSTVDNEKLPEGCKTFMDFLNLPKNFDFRSMVNIALQGNDELDGIENLASGASTEEAPRYTGKYSDSFFENMFYSKPYKRRYSSADGEPEAAELDRVYDQIKGKPPGQLVPTQKQSPLEKIREDHLMFDAYGYIRHYLTKLNRYNYQVLSGHHKSDETLNYYLNNEYIDRIRRPFPPKRDHTEMIRNYFSEILPSIMDNLVNLIKDDPNKRRTPSPPLHDFTLAPGFKLPDYMQPGYESDDERTGGYQEADFSRYSSLQGLHEPDKYLHYPYADLEPLYQRQLLAMYLDMLRTGDFGEPETYKKFKSKAASIRNEMYPDQTKLPQEIYGHNIPKTEDLNLDEPVTLTKVYERGGRKRAVAVVYLEPGNGHIIINNRDGYQYVRYCTDRLREMLEPLDAIYAYKKFNIVAKVHGGGISGQTGAIRHALARYITKVLAPKLEPYLKMRGLTKADTRQVERKKTNLRKARKKEHYSKR